jgi:choline dehydrogenase-like flavoprotein
MGHNPKTSVLNAFNQVHDARNVFVTDASCFVTSSCYEPTLTLMALSLRAADFIVEESKRGNL